MMSVLYLDIPLGLLKYVNRSYFGSLLGFLGTWQRYLPLQKRFLSVDSLQFLSRASFHKNLQNDGLGCQRQV